MNVQELLRTRKMEITAARVELDNEERQIDLALNAMVKVKQPETVGATARADKPVPVKKEDAIVDAVQHGQRTPSNIHKFLKKEMGVEINIGSLRSTLSRLKSEGRVKRDASGWTL